MTGAREDVLGWGCCTRGGGGVIQSIYTKCKDLDCIYTMLK